MANEERSKFKYTLAGQIFGTLIVLDDFMDYTCSEPRHKCKCFCVKCKQIRNIYAQFLKTGHTKSCRCSKGERISNKKTKHGMVYTKFYKKFQSILTRCNNPKSKRYKDYGGRGIKCLWNSFEEFKDDMYESYLKHVEEFGESETTIERIDVNGNYCKENCIWATNHEQSLNQRRTCKYTYKGKTMTLWEWSRELGINYSTLKSRLKLYHWDVDKAFSIPAYSNNLHITLWGEVNTIVGWAKKLNMTVEEIKYKYFVLGVSDKDLMCKCNEEVNYE